MNNSIIFVATNGAGLGHLTRSIAIAKELRKMDNSLEIIFYTTSLALEAIRNQGFRFYYTPSKLLMPEHVTTTAWSNMMKRQLQDIMSIHEASGIVFDGAYPYAGVVGALKEFHQLKAIWIKRETYKKGSDHYRTLETLFDKVIVPKEAGADKEELVCTENRVYCAPIVGIKQEEAYTREQVRKMLRVESHEKVVYVQLGAGNLNNIEQPISQVIEGILKLGNFKVLLGESIIGQPLNITKERVQTIRNYPNSMYFKGIDYAVSAAGYNTFHELLYFNIPTIFIPNTKTKKDDQKKRAMWAHEANAAICMDKPNATDISLAMKQLRKYKEKFVENMKIILPQIGTEAAAQSLLEIIKQ